MPTIHYEIETTRKELEIRSGKRKKRKQENQRMKEKEKTEKFMEDIGRFEKKQKKRR